MPNCVTLVTASTIPQIGPDGKIMARDLRGPRIKEAVGSALEKH